MSLLLDLFIDFAKKRGLLSYSFLIGGTVRDILIAKRIHDIDITITRDAEDIAKAFADSIGASFVILDEQFGIIRVVKEAEFIDFCKLKGDNIIDDLATRDFTINAMAINLSHYASLKITNPSEIKFNLIKEFLIDPFDGLKDLELRIIRMVSQGNLQEDPLRLLRAYRFAAILDFSIEINTYHAICKLSPFISRIAVERITEELRHILKHKFSYKKIEDMQKSGLLVNILPEIVEISPQLLSYNISAYRYLEHILNNISLYFSDYREYFLNYFTKSYKIICLKFIILLSSLHLIDKASMRLKMSKKERNFMHNIGFLYDKFLSLKDSKKGGKIEFLRESREYLYPLVFLSLAKELISCPNQNQVFLFCYEMLDLYHNEIMPKLELLPILTGDDLIGKLGLSPSPLFKNILDMIELLFLKGEINNKREALKTANELIKKVY